ncbi:MBL fold metallo-hydrolase [Tellurirhabdus rosea]|uniref:MBL fold metallo-hydrolase n=1 Tax=Tellurirhabdus rosea TaxID=2674997 RepID=UPI0022507C6B|nr:MBL fold metallo-hydrolase [Tellurirhabdus rosea]
MKTTRHLRHGPVEGFRFGYAPIPYVPVVPVYCYFLDGLLIDTAQRHRQADVLRTLADRPLQQIVLTHFHEDHSGNVLALHRRFGVPVFAGELTARRVGAGFPVLPYEQFWFGRIEPCPGIQPLPEVVETNRYRLQPIHTPGHSDDHYVFLEANEGWLFAGDFYIGNLKIFRRGENFQQHIDSARRLLACDFDTLFCGHNPVLTNGKAAILRKIEYLEAFRERARHFHGQGLSLPEIRRRMRLSENYLLKIFTFNDVGVDLMIEAALRS